MKNVRAQHPSDDIVGWNHNKIQLRRRKFRKSYSISCSQREQSLPSYGLSIQNMNVTAKLHKSLTTTLPRHQLHHYEINAKHEWQMPKLSLGLAQRKFSSIYKDIVD